MTHVYGDGSNSAIGTQFRTDYYYAKALQEMAKEQYFAPLSTNRNMPKHYGKTIKQYHYMPLLDDRNVNDQGISPNAVSNDSYDRTIKIIPPGVDGAAGDTADKNYGIIRMVTTHANATTALTNARIKVAIFLNNIEYPGDYAAAVALAEADNYAFEELAAVPATGNLYGSTKDIGSIAGKFPTLSENGGYVNKVGFTRIDLEGTINKFGFYYDFTQESLDFDTDAELDQHLAREAIFGAGEINEDMLQIDLLNGAGIVRYAGEATSNATMDGNTSVKAAVTYEDLMRLSIDLDNSRTPKKTKIIKGSLMTDTRVLDSARVLYCGSEMLPLLKKMEDGFGSQAFIAVQHYAAATEIMTGEAGTIDQFRIVVVPEMMHWAAVGAAAGANVPGYRTSVNIAGNELFDVYPLLCVGSESFVTVGFQTDGKMVKFKIKTAKPGSIESYANDPYGETGFSSIKWYYGTMILRNERIALLKSLALL